MRGLGGEVFAQFPGVEGAREEETGAQISAILARESPESTRNSLVLTQNSPNLTQIGPHLARKSPGWLMVGSRERGEGFLCGEGVGGCLVGVRENFGLLNFCCTRGGEEQGRGNRE